MDRPPVNGLKVQFQNELGDTFEEIQTNNHVGAVIITGASADIKTLSKMGQKEALRISESTQDVLNIIHAFDRVVIAVVNGLALGVPGPWLVT